jgi:hypothetical protein
MEFQGRSKLILFVAIAAVAVAIGWRYLVPTATVPDPGYRRPVKENGGPAPAPAPDPRPARPPSPIPTDPVLRQWVVSIKTHHRQGVEGAQSALLAQESQYGEKLKALAREDSDPRVRAFTISLLGRMKSRPAEEFFIERLEDPEQYPRTSALLALEQAGSTACLAAVDRLASSDPVPEVRAAAGKTAKAVRSR